MDEGLLSYTGSPHPLSARSAPPGALLAASIIWCPEELLQRYAHRRGALSPPVSPGLLPAQWGLYRTSQTGWGFCRTSRTSRTSRTALSCIGQVGQVGRVGRRWALSDKSDRSDVQPISSSAAPLPAPGTDGCPIGGVERSRRPTGPIGPTRLIRQRARPIG